MRPGTKSTWERSALRKVGLFILSALLPLSLVACASAPSRLTQLAPENQGDFLVARAAEPLLQPADNRNPLQVCTVVPEEELHEMRGCQGAYFFEFNFDINMVASPEVSVKTNFTAAVPDGAPAPSFNGTTAVFSDKNVLYMAGPTGNGMMSEVVVTGHNNIVFANTNFNIRMPNTSIIAPSINVLPAASLNGIGVK